MSPDRAEKFHDPTLTDQAEQAVAQAAAVAPPVSLAEVNAAAALQTRVDNKYLLSAAQFTDLMQRVGLGLSVLEIDEKRAFAYESVYFDTPDLAHFREHKQGRRQRYKVRTRTYVDTGACMFEVKVKGLRGATVKRRIPHPVPQRMVLSTPSRDFLNEQLRSEYGITAPDLVPALRTEYQRATFVNLTNGERLTCDTTLVFHSNDTTVTGPDKIIVETKTADGGGSVGRALAQMGVRPVSMSKYCIGTALVHPELAANKWNQLLRNHFGWSRDSSHAIASAA